jgi:PAS domain S-box-containing protein
MDSKIVNAPVNILMVDDQPGKLLSYETILADSGENLIRANSGNEALDILLRKDIAVVLVDVCMPELDGFELAAMIRSHPRFRRTSIILISSVLVEDVHRLKGYDSGAVDYVSVPIVPEILRAKVAIFADLYRKTEALEELNRDLEQRVDERTREIARANQLLRSSEQRFRLLVENIPDYAILMLDPEGRISSWSAGAERLYGWTSDEVIGFSISKTFLPEDINEGRPERLLAIAAEKGHSEDEGWRVRRDGTGFWAHVVLTALHDPEDKLIGFSKIVHDVTDRKRAEEERVLLLKRAEDARREAEAANQLKNEFLAVLSHELRTPLNAITGWAHMLRAGGLDFETQRKAVETINRNALLQARLISDLLDVSRIVSGKLSLEFKPVDMTSVVRAAVDTLRVASEDKEMKVDVEIDSNSCMVRGDAFRLQQVVWNLVSNAIKFAPRQGSILVALKKTQFQVELSVQDNGPGIREELLPHIFEPFRQEDSSSTRSHQGLGLGLAIVRNLLRLHDGTVEAANRPDGEGAIFTVALPCLDVSMQSSGPGESQNAGSNEEAWTPDGSSLQDLRILVVDDEADAREVAGMILERCGAEILTCSNASGALEVLQRERPDVLVADIEMPGEDGYSLIRRVRLLRPSAGGNIAAIALTAHAAAHDLPKLMSAGFNRHVPKPFQPGELVRAIAGLTKPLQQSDRSQYAAPSGARSRAPF